MELIDIRIVFTQIAGFLVLVWALRKWAFGPLTAMLEARRQKIVGEFQHADGLKNEALELKSRYENDLKGIDAQARQKLQDAVAEGQRVAGEIKSQAQTEAQQRLERAQDEIAREREKAKELMKEQIVTLSMRTAEKILRQKLDDPTQRKLVGEFVDEVSALK
jgi:F-type H+-transporting ATPase subunit b